MFISDHVHRSIYLHVTTGHRVKIRAPGQSGHGPSYIEQLRTQNTIDNVDCGPCRALPGPTGPLKVAGPLGICPPAPLSAGLR